MRELNAARSPFLIGGAYALEWHAGIPHRTKDLDIMVRPDDCKRVLDLMEAEGFRTEMPFSHWLGKIHCDGEFIDVIFNMGNGLAPVDDAWLDHAEHGTILGMTVNLCSAVELLFSKAFVMERERFDGADVAHIIRSCGERLDWRRLIDRFGPHWRVLLSHLVLFGYVYPAEQTRIPEWVLKLLLKRILDSHQTHNGEPNEKHVCQGTLLSREQYLMDIEQWGYEDARLRPRGNMSKPDIAAWTDAANCATDSTTSKVTKTSFRNRKRNQS